MTSARAKALAERMAHEIITAHVKHCTEFNPVPPPPKEAALIYARTIAEAEEALASGIKHAERLADALEPYIDAVEEHDIDSLQRLSAFDDERAGLADSLSKLRALMDEKEKANG